MVLPGQSNLPLFPIYPESLEDLEDPEGQQALRDQSARPLLAFPEIPGDHVAGLPLPWISCTENIVSLNDYGYDYIPLVRVHLLNKQV